MGEPARSRSGSTPRMAAATSAEERAGCCCARSTAPAHSTRSYFALFSPDRLRLRELRRERDLGVPDPRRLRHACIEYSVLPSSLSLTRVPAGTHQTRMVMNGIVERLMARPADGRPTFVLFGESLGCQVSQEMFARPGIDRSGRHRARLRRLDRHAGGHRVAQAAVGHAQRGRGPPRWDPDDIYLPRAVPDWHDLPAAERERVRFLLLQNGDDPIPKFECSAALAPTGLAGAARPAPVRCPARHPVVAGDDVLRDLHRPAERPRPDPRASSSRGATTTGSRSPRRCGARSGCEATDDQMGRVQDALRRRRARLGGQAAVGRGRGDAHAPAGRGRAGAGRRRQPVDRTRRRRRRHPPHHRRGHPARLTVIRVSPAAVVLTACAGQARRRRLVARAAGAPPSGRPGVARDRRGRAGDTPGTLRSTERRTRHSRPMGRTRGWPARSSDDAGIGVAGAGLRSGWRTEPLGCRCSKSKPSARPDEGASRTDDATAARRGSGAQARRAARASRGLRNRWPDAERTSGRCQRRIKTLIVTAPESRVRECVTWRRGSERAPARRGTPSKPLRSHYAAWHADTRRSPRDRRTRSTHRKAGQAINVQLELNGLGADVAGQLRTAGRTPNGRSERLRHDLQVAPIPAPKDAPPPTQRGGDRQATRALPDRICRLRGTPDPANAHRRTAEELSKKDKKLRHRAAAAAAGAARRPGTGPRRTAGVRRSRSPTRTGAGRHGWSR